MIKTTLKKFYINAWISIKNLTKKNSNNFVGGFGLYVGGKTQNNYNSFTPIINSIKFTPSKYNINTALNYTQSVGNMTINFSLKNPVTGMTLPYKVLITEYNSYLDNHPYTTPNGSTFIGIANYSYNISVTPGKQFQDSIIVPNQTQFEKNGTTILKLYVINKYDATIASSNFSISTKNITTNKLLALTFTKTNNSQNLLKNFSF